MGSRPRPKTQTILWRGLEGSIQLLDSQAVCDPRLQDNRVILALAVRCSGLGWGNEALSYSHGFPRPP